VSKDDAVGNCGFSISVEEYGYPVDLSAFKFSADNGVHYQEKPVFISKTPGMFAVKVKKEKGCEDTIYFAFKNPFIYVPKVSCMPVVPDPCDCENLRITGVEKKQISNKEVIVVHVSQPNCGIVYSISGKNGKYQQDSVFSRFTPQDSIFVKSTKCTNPVAYSNNPFIAIPVVEKIDKPRVVSTQKGYKESDVDPKPYPGLYENRQELIAYISNQIQDMGTHGDIVIGFTVETMGNVVRFQNINNVSQALNDRVIRTINKLGNWNPGYKGNNPVDTYVTLRIPAN
jgi:hypothetical protein